MAAKTKAYWTDKTVFTLLGLLTCREKSLAMETLNMMLIATTKNKKQKQKKENCTASSQAISLHCFLLSYMYPILFVVVDVLRWHQDSVGTTKNSSRKTCYSFTLAKKHCQGRSVKVNLLTIHSGNFFLVKKTCQGKHCSCKTALLQCSSRKIYRGLSTWQKILQYYILPCRRVFFSECLKRKTKDF